MGDETRPEKPEKRTEPRSHEYDAAFQALWPIEEFDWLTKSDVQWFSITEVARATGVGKESIRKWCENGEFPDAMNYQPVQIGWRIPKSNLIIFFGSVRRSNAKRA